VAEACWYLKGDVGRGSWEGGGDGGWMGCFGGEGCVVNAVGEDGLVESGRTTSGAW
jgi:hypothetical protein